MRALDPDRTGKLDLEEFLSVMDVDHGAVALRQEGEEASEFTLYRNIRSHTSRLHVVEAEIRRVQEEMEAKRIAMGGSRKQFFQSMSQASMNTSQGAGGGSSASLATGAGGSSTASLVAGGTAAVAPAEPASAATDEDPVKFQV